MCVCVCEREHQLRSRKVTKRMAFSCGARKDFRAITLRIFFQHSLLCEACAPIWSQSSVALSSKTVAFLYLFIYLFRSRLRFSISMDDETKSVLKDLRLDGFQKVVALVAQCRDYRFQPPDLALLRHAEIFCVVLRKNSCSSSGRGRRRCGCKLWPVTARISQVP